MSRSLRTLTLGLCCALVLGGCGLSDTRRQAIEDAQVKPLDLTSALRPGLVGMPDYPATGWEPGELAEDSSTAKALAKIALQSSDVAAEYTVSELSDGASLEVPTMDFCAAKYPSERDRVARLQNAAFDADGNFTGLSSEIVIYTSAAAAAQALREATQARLSCPTDRVVTTADGHNITFTFHTAPGPSDTPLTDPDSRLIIHTSMKVDGKDRTSFLVYQVDANVLAALYVTDAIATPFDQSMLDSFYSLAGEMANRLRAYNSKTST